MNDTSSPHALSTRIKDEALRLGFDDCRICRADPPDQEQQQALRDWIAGGMHGGMTWFERSTEARLDIRTRYPWAQSVVVLRMDYAQKPPTLDAASIIHRIARYASGLDYHEWHRERLAALEAFIVSLDPPSPARWYQDTGPVLEHVYAARAGIGWTGKHTLTLNAAEGSWFFLAEIFTALRLMPDQAATSHCGTCTACIDACPTGAIVAPFKLDARRCISYLTIEHRGIIAPELRGSLAGNLYGCDICQDVCPYNRKHAPRHALRAVDEAWRKPELERLSLLEVLELSDDQLELALVGTPLARSGSARLKRNAAVLAGNERIQEARAGLRGLCGHADEHVREAAVWALGQLE